MRVVIAGGGTAGHVNPGVALARALSEHDVSFVGTRRGAEARLVPAAGMELDVVDIRGFDRARPWALPGVGLRAVAAVAAARRILRARAPAVVVGMGGYVSLPVCFAARAARIPVVLHEQNIVLGLANRVCAPLARVIATSWEETLDSVGDKGIFVGNPVLPEIYAVDLDEARGRAVERFSLDAARKTLLVFGGSQGAKRINDAARGLRDEWRDRADRQVLHILGSAQASTFQADAGPGATLVYRAVDYVDDMALAYAAADLALCRGGATSVAELGAVGLPAIVVPYPHHRDRQQERHGRVMERAGAAVVLDDAETTGARVAAEVDRLFDDDAELERMRKSAQSFGRPDAARALARVVEEAA